MEKKITIIDMSQGNGILKRLVAFYIISSLAGLGAWTWIQQNPNLFPLPASKQGRSILRFYQELTHDFWLILLLLAVGYLTTKTYINRTREKTKNNETTQGPIASSLQFIRNNPITTIIFTIYTVAMISGTTYLYKDMVGWYPDLLQGHFLDNFSPRQSFIAETMRRTDYRFFPLAHQDIHILSWFTIHIKTWMLFSAAELIGIVLLSIHFLNNLEGAAKAKASTILLLTALLLIHPSTGTAFFHVIYCERILCLVFILFINSYLRHLKSHSRSSFYESLLWAIIGIFIKDIALLLFLIPPASLWATDTIRLRRHKRDQPAESTPIRQNHQLERWLCSFSLLFIASYIILALIPSSYSSEAAYNNDVNHKISLDLRFYIFALIITVRTTAIIRRRLEFCLLDAMNISAIGYAIALASTYQFVAGSYLSLPFQLIASINIAWAWVELVETRGRRQPSKENKRILYAALASSALIGGDHLTSNPSFISEIKEQKLEQSYIQSTYEELDRTTRKIRELGDNVDIIINKSSRLSAKRHLYRIPYRSLTEFIPEKDEFIVKDGAGKGSTYRPKIGDIIANLDKEIDLIEPILSDYKTEMLYRHNPSTKTGAIFRITGLKQK